MPCARSLSSTLLAHTSGRRTFIVDRSELTAPHQLLMGSTPSIILQANASLTSVAFSPDGTLLATGSTNRTTKMWRVADGVCTATLAGHKNGVTSVAFSPDGTLLVTGSWDSTTKLWRVADGVCTATLAGHKKGVTSVAFSPDGTLLATGSADETTKLWRVADGVCTATLAGHTGDVTSVAFSPDGDLLATGSNDETTKLWRVADGVCSLTLIGHTFLVTSVAFSPDGAQLATGSADETAKMWRVADGVCTATLAGHISPVSSVAFSPNGALLATGSDENTTNLWRVADGMCTSAIGSHRSHVRSVAFSPDGTQLATCSNDGTTKLWLVTDDVDVCTATFAGRIGDVTSVAFSPDGTLLAAGSDSTTKLWRAADGVCTTLTGHYGFVTSVVFSPDGSLLATGSNDETTKLWCVTDGVCIATLAGHSRGVRSVAFSPQEMLLATGSDDCTTMLWRAAATGVCTTLTGHTGFVTSVAFSPDGTLLATGSNDKTTKLWRVADGVCTATLVGHTSAATSVTFSPDGKLLATLGRDGLCCVWAVGKKEPVGKTIVSGAFEAGDLCFASSDDRSCVLEHQFWGGSKRISVDLLELAPACALGGKLAQTLCPSRPTPSMLLWSTLLQPLDVGAACQQLRYEEHERIFLSPTQDAAHPCHRLVCTKAGSRANDVRRVVMVGTDAPTANCFIKLHEAEMNSRALNPVLRIKNSTDAASVAGLDRLKQFFIPAITAPGDPVPAARLLLAWHGTSADKVTAVCRDGPRSLRTTDSGYFGAGSYFALEAAYALRYSTPDPASGESALILYVVSVSQAKVITPQGDYRREEDPSTPHLHGFSQYYSGNPDTAVALAPGCDAHFIPVKHYGLTHPLTGLPTPRNVDYQAVDASIDAAEGHEIVIASYHRCIPIAVVYF